MRLTGEIHVKLHRWLAASRRSRFVLSVFLASERHLSFVKDYRPLTGISIDWKSFVKFKTAQILSEIVVGFLNLKCKM
jgi:hypothetical protein